MDPNRQTAIGAREQFGPLHLSAGEVFAEDFGVLVPWDGQEDVLVPLSVGGLDGSKGAHHVGAEGPGAGRVGLVGVEPNHAALEVEVRPAERQGLGDAHPFASQEGVERSALERDGATGQESRFLVGVEPSFCLRVSSRRKPARGQGRGLPQAARVHGKLEHSGDDLAVLATGCRAQARGECSHGAIGILETEVSKSDPSDGFREHVDSLAIEIRCSLRLYMVREAVVQRARGPLIGELGKGDGRALLPCRRASVFLSGLDNGFESRLGARPSGAGEDDSGFLGGEPSDNGREVSELRGSGHRLALISETDQELRLLSASVAEAGFEAFRRSLKLW